MAAGIPSRFSIIVPEWSNTEKSVRCCNFNNVGWLFYFENWIVDGLPSSTRRTYADHTRRFSLIYYKETPWLHGRRWRLGRVYDWYASEWDTPLEVPY
jgi:hypothetical protein